MQSKPPIIKPFLLLTVIVILALSYNAVFWSDDYAAHFRLMVHNDNIWKYLWAGYLEWDGRYVSLQGLVQIVFIRYLPASVSVFIWSLCMLWLARMLVEIIVLETKIKDPGISKGWLALFVFVLLWFGFSYHINDTVYFVTGGVYILSLALCFSWVLFYMKKVHRRNRGVLFVGFLFSLVAGLSGINATIPLLTFIGIDVLRNRKDFQGNWVSPLLYATGLLISSIVFVVAPGNYIRATFHSNSFTTDVPFLMLKGLEIVARYLYYSLPAIAGALALGLLLPLSESLQKGIKFVALQPGLIIKAVRVDSLLDFLHRYRWFIIALSCITPFLAVPDFSSRRTSSFFMVFVFIGVVELTHRISSFRSAESLHRFQIAGWVVRATFTLFLWVTMGVAASHFYTGSQIRSQIEEREARFESLRSLTDTVYVEPIRVSDIPFSSKFHDLLCHSYARYHGFQAVLMDTTAREDMPWYYVRAPR